MGERKIIRRIGTSPQERGSATNISCPDLFELDDLSYAAMGTDIDLLDQDPRHNDLKEEILATLEARGASLGDRKVIVVTRQALIDACKDVPDQP